VNLLPRVAAGDRLAVRECLSRYGGLVWSLARRAAPSAADAEDAVQEVFLDLWKNAARFDPRVASEPTFVAMIARRRLIDRLRRRQRRLDTEPLSERGHAVESGVPAPELGIEAAKAARAIAGLGPDQRRVLMMTTAEGLTHEEVAKTTGMPLGTVKAHARRGLLRVREALAGATVPAGVGA
jgi:RNA polymerase sigma-70 factor (ECF subfamily)